VGERILCGRRGSVLLSIKFTPLESPVSQRVQQISRLLKERAVALRLAAGSQELGFLASFCPITKFPTVVVIRCAVG